ncbi:MAG: YeeE/YedE family protein [Gammaproteobacteria bacterium]
MSVRSLHLWRALVSLGSGLVFGVGLALSHMTDPERVLGFLDVTGQWDPRLLGVLGGAVAVTALSFRRLLGRPAPRLDGYFHLPPYERVDARLLLGSVLFGTGWGIAGYCPGPAIAVLGSANNEVWWLVPAMLVGMGLQRWQADHQQGLHS